jgi:segregation and condensation protein B
LEISLCRVRWKIADFCGTIKDMDGLSARLEALLFVYGDLLALKKAASVLAVDESQLKDAVEALSRHLEEMGSGLTLLRHDDGVQLVTRSEYAQLLSDVLKAELHETLTPASLETLAIITYAAPISRAEIDYIRGVNASYTVRALALRGLIDREADPQRAHVFLYRPSAELIRYLGVSSVEQLPEYEHFRTVAARIKNPPAAAPSPEPTNLPTTV